MSAEVIPFMPRPKHNRVPTGFRRLVFRSTARPDDLAADHADMSPREYVEAIPKESGLNMAKALTEIRSLARTYTRSAIRTLVTVMCHPKASAAAKVAAANSILDRGWGKATQPIGNGEDGAAGTDP